MSGVAIRGDGVAACAVARLLSVAGQPIQWDRGNRPTQPAVMLGQATLRLLEDVFESRELVAGFQPVRHRCVLWGSNAITQIAHAAVVGDEGTLLARLRARCEPTSIELGDSDWSITAMRRYPVPVATKSFGDRTATAFPVKLVDTAPAETCWMESLDRGWLFLLPEGNGQARLLAVGDLDGDGLQDSRMIAKQVDAVLGEGISFPSYPQITDPMGGDRWLACGTAALSFDPVCGEGAGHALREAILASAVLRATAASPAAEAALTAHYRSRMLAGFARHLETCFGFYTRGPRSPWWDQQIASLREGAAWCVQQLAATPSARYQLEGFDLRPL